MVEYLFDGIDFGALDLAEYLSSIQAPQALLVF